MNLTGIAIILVLGGVMITGFVHSPRTLVVGLGMVIVSQMLMYYCGYRRGNKRHA